MRHVRTALLVLAAAFCAGICHAQAPAPALSRAGAPAVAPASEKAGGGRRQLDDGERVSASVEVKPVNRDLEIAARLERILAATDWFTSPGVTVREGVVFLSGTAPNDQLRKWAGTLAGNTRDVVAVVNRMELARPSLLDLRPAWEQLRELWTAFLKSLPLAGLALVVLLAAWAAGLLATWLARRALRQRGLNHLLEEVLARAAGIAMFMTGLYIVLVLSGLAKLAATVVGGTGLAGLVIGIAFRDITENFLASVFLSMQNPFHTGDLVEIDGVLGTVRRLTIRATVLMTVDGQFVQIPNATVYKTKIRNLTSNPKRRQDFALSIGYSDSVAKAQTRAMDTLRDHPAVLDDPEPWVLVDSLGPYGVNLKAYFWTDTSRDSLLKVRSSVIRLVKKSLQEAGFAMEHDDPRELTMPKELAVRMIDPRRGTGRATETDIAPPPESAAVATPAEAGLTSETRDTARQAAGIRDPEEGPNLLR